MSSSRPIPDATLAALTARAAPLKMVIFDCDGVLIDSENIASAVVASMITEAGFAMTPEQAEHRFVGHSLRDMVPVIEGLTGKVLGDPWRETLRDRLLLALQHAPTVEGAVEALISVSAMGLPWRIASNSSHEEMAVKFSNNGLTDLVRGKLHSHRDVPRGKPAPDLFLAAASAEGIAPENCLVIEDSVPGTQGALAAGMMVLGFAPKGDGARLAALGALPFHDMAQIPDLLRAALGTHA